MQFYHIYFPSVLQILSILWPIIASIYYAAHRYLMLCIKKIYEVNCRQAPKLIPA